MGIGVQGKHQLPHPPDPLPAPVLHAEDRPHARDACSEQRQRIKGTFAYPQRPGAGLQRGGVEVALGARQMIVVLRLRNLLCSAHRTPIQVHEATIWRRMRKDHAAAAPVAGWVRPGARRRGCRAGRPGGQRAAAPADTAPWAWVDRTARVICAVVTSTSHAPRRSVVASGNKRERMACVCVETKVGSSSRR